jgi:TIR domain
VRKLFISYARDNKRDVDQLVAHLGTMGYDTWVDAALRGGQDWWNEILQRIADTDVVIAIYSAAALNSTACGREFEWAVALGKPVVPVAVEPPPTALPTRFARRQIIDYSEPAERPLAALKLQGALATLPTAPALPDPLPEPPKAPMSYLTDIIDLITQANALDHDQQHQILHQLEPALTSFDPLERQGGRDILERFSARGDLYADVDRAIRRLRQLRNQPVHVDDTEPSTQDAASTTAAEPTEDARDVAADLVGRSPNTTSQDAGEPIGATTAAPPPSPASLPEAQLTPLDEPRPRGPTAGKTTAAHPAAHP